MSDLGIAHTLDSECINIISDRYIFISAVNDRNTHIVQNDSEHIDGKQEITVTKTSTVKVTGAVSETFEDTQTTDVKNAITVTSQTAHIYIHGCTSIHLHVGESSLWMASDGNIELKGKNVVIIGSEKVHISGDHIVSAAKSSHDISGDNVKSEAGSINIVKGSTAVMLNP